MPEIEPAPSAPTFPPDGIVSLARQVRRRERSPVELVEASLAAIAAADGALNAFTAVAAERALDDARRLADRIARGEAAGPLAGIPFAVKELEDAAGLRTTHGDPALADRPPATRDSLQVARLRAAGAIVVGKTNSPVYGHKGETDNPLFGTTRNPYAPSRTPGGSSGGSAAAIAAGMVPLATGSDGGGSIRIPASCCNLAGFKPTYGIVPRDDEHGSAWGHLSTRGPMARTFAEVGAALDVVAGFTAGDLAAIPPPGSFAAAAARGVTAGLRVAWSPTLGYATPTAPVMAVCEPAVRVLGELGARVEEVATVLPQDPVADWLTLVAAGSRRELELLGVPFTGAAAHRFEPSFLWMLERGGTATAVEHVAALDGCYQLGRRLAAVWERFDLLACPVTADVAPPIGGRSVLGPSWIQLTYPFNMAACAAASVPAGFATVDGETVPVGLQLVAPRLADLRLLGTAAALEAAIGAVARRPGPAG
jgi:aspartyl-tRNA(Asn)/glutamyl-tRNA(Gln) amidotransferase subunit A